jgi:glycosyltransferase involved in cell wall biosynthesis
MISIIIPTFNEAANLPRLLEAIAGPGVPREILVVDGGSSDGTPEIAIRAGVACLGSEPGRGQQLVAGAAAASGDILLFLHADSLFPAGGLERIEEILAVCPDIVGGNFALTFDGGDGFSRWLNGFYGWFAGAASITAIPASSCAGPSTMPSAACAQSP